jgi:hypothetical protein
LWIGLEQRREREGVEDDMVEAGPTVNVAVVAGETAAHAKIASE